MLIKQHSFISTFEVGRHHIWVTAPKITVALLEFNLVSLLPIKSAVPQTSASLQTE